MRGGWTKLRHLVSGYFSLRIYVSFEKKPFFSPGTGATKSLRGFSQGLLYTWTDHSLSDVKFTYHKRQAMTFSVMSLLDVEIVRFLGLTPKTIILQKKSAKYENHTN